MRVRMKKRRMRPKLRLRMTRIGVRLRIRIRFRSVRQTSLKLPSLTAESRASCDPPLDRLGCAFDIAPPGCFSVWLNTVHLNTHTPNPKFHATSLSLYIYTYIHTYIHNYIYTHIIISTHMYNTTYMTIVYSDRQP